MITYLLLSLVLGITIRIVMIGAKANEPPKGWRKVVVKFVGQVIVRTALFVQSFVWVSHRNMDVDYSEWLGADWKSGQPLSRAPIIVANHQSWSVFLVFCKTCRTSC